MCVNYVRLHHCSGTMLQCVWSVQPLLCIYVILQGGLKAVVWADTFQMVIMIGGFIAVLITGIVRQGGFANVIEANRVSGRLDILE